MFLESFGGTRARVFDSWAREQALMTMVRDERATHCERLLTRASSRPCHAIVYGKRTSNRDNVRAEMSGPTPYGSVERRAAAAWDSCNRGTHHCFVRARPTHRSVAARLQNVAPAARDIRARNV